MKRIFKGLIFLAIIIVICGCGSNENNKIEKAYNNSKIGKDIKGYVFDLRIYGTNENNKVFKTVRINNYKNTDLEISLYTNLEQKQYAIKKGKTYLFNKDNEYEKADDLKYYNNTDIFLEAAKNLKTSKFLEQKEEGKNKYDVYDVTFEKKYIDKLLKNIDVKITSKGTATGEIWIDGDNRIYKINYKLKDFEIYTAFFAYNSTGSIVITEK